MIPFGMTWSIVSIILVIFGAGILNPLVRWVTVFNLIISFLATVIFEYQAVVSYRNIYSNLDTGFFVVNQVLALMFLISAYYGAKSMRGFLVKGKIVS
jgi:hypothetical protein